MADKHMKRYMTSLIIQMREIKSNERNANKNNNEISPHTSQNGPHQKVYKQQILERVQRKGNALALLVGI